jgi:hypothetical protein
VAKFRERLAGNKQISHRFHMEKFSLKTLKEAEGKGLYRDRKNAVFCDVTPRGCWVLKEPHCVTSQKTAFFIGIIVTTSYLAYH